MFYVPSLGKEHNFNTYNDTTSSSLGVPYDYGSMMHYSKTAFSKEGDATIVTNIPAFSDVIGQRMEFSDSDLLKLHRLYNCSKKCWISTITYLSHKLLRASDADSIAYLLMGRKTDEADKQEQSPGAQLVYGGPKG